MAIVRVIKDKKHPYLLMNKTGLDDTRLSFKATGLLSYLLSKPDNWYISYKNLISSKTDGLRSLTSAFKELLHFGYITKAQLRNDNGQYGPYYYSVFEIPQFPTSLKYKPPPKSRYAISDKPISDNSILLSNKEKIINKRNNNSTVDDSAFHTPAADVSFSPEQYKETIQILNELKIINHKILFDLYPLADILSYAYWIREKNVKMKNPTGFIITALKEKWKEQEPIDNTKGLRVFFQECTVCFKSFAYQEYEELYHICPKCSKEHP
ncbi:hypothetical protein ES703_16646 [subsurface metagenome]